MNHSQQLWPCLTVLLMCFLLAGKTRQAAPAPGLWLVAVGRAEGRTWEPSWDFPLYTGAVGGSGHPSQAHWVLSTPLPHNSLLHSAFQLLGVFCSQTDSHIHTQLFLKSQTLCLAEQEYFTYFKNYFTEGTTQRNVPIQNLQPQELPTALCRSHSMMDGKSQPLCDFRELCLSFTPPAQLRSG